MSKRSVAASRLEFIPPLVPTLVDQPPEGESWIHEVKLDGYRAQVIVQDGAARVYTRERRDRDPWFFALGLPSSILDVRIFDSGDNTFDKSAKMLNSRIIDLDLVAIVVDTIAMSKMVARYAGVD